MCYTVCPQAACSPQDLSPVLLFLWGLSSWLQQANVLAGTLERSRPWGPCSASPACPLQRGRKLRWERTQQISKIFFVCKGGVLFVTSLIRTLGPAYTHHLQSSSQNVKRKNSSNKSIKYTDFLKIPLYGFNTIVFHKMFLQQGPQI